MMFFTGFMILAVSSCLADNPAPLHILALSGALLGAVIMGIGVYRDEHKNR